MNRRSNIIHLRRKDRFVDEFIGRSIHGKGELLFLEIELGVDAIGIAARIDANPFAEAGEIDGIEPVQNCFVIIGSGIAA